MNQRVQEKAAVDDLTFWSWLLGTIAIVTVFLLGTGFFDWKYDPSQPSSGAVVQSEVSPSYLFEQQQCAFLWFGCKNVQSHYRLGIVGDDKTGVIVVTLDVFENYPVGSYYP